MTTRSGSAMLHKLAAKHAVQFSDDNQWDKYYKDLRSDDVKAVDKAIRFLWSRLDMTEAILWRVRQEIQQARPVIMALHLPVPGSEQARLHKLLKQVEKDVQDAVTASYVGKRDTWIRDLVHVDMSPDERVARANELGALAVRWHGATEATGHFLEAAKSLLRSDQENGLLKLLDDTFSDENTMYQEALVRVLGRWGGQSSSSVLGPRLAHLAREQLWQGHEALIQSYVEACTQLGGPDVVESFKGVLETTTVDQVRERVLHGLAAVIDGDAKMVTHTRPRRDYTVFSWTAAAHRRLTGLIEILRQVQHHAEASSLTKLDAEVLRLRLEAEQPGLSKPVFAG